MKRHHLFGAMLRFWNRNILFCVVESKENEEGKEESVAATEKNNTKEEPVEHVEEGKAWLHSMPVLIVDGLDYRINFYFEEVNFVPIVLMMMSQELPCFVLFCLKQMEKLEWSLC